MGARNHENVSAECCLPLGQVMTSTTGRCPRFYTIIQENAIVTLQKAVIALGKGTGSTTKNMIFGAGARLPGEMPADLDRRSSLYTIETEGKQPEQERRNNQIGLESHCEIKCAWMRPS
jgi:hypothetical protein